LLMTWSYLRAG